LTHVCAEVDSRVQEIGNAPLIYEFVFVGFCAGQTARYGSLVSLEVPVDYPEEYKEEYKWEIAPRFCFAGNSRGSQLLGADTANLAASLIGLEA
jgi:hypothetical protein